MDKPQKTHEVKKARHKRSGIIWFPSLWNTQNRQILGDRKQACGYQERDGKWLLLGTGVSFWGDENVVELDPGDGWTTVGIYWIVYF